MSNPYFQFKQFTAWQQLHQFPMLQYLYSANYVEPTLKRPTRFLSQHPEYYAHLEQNWKKQIEVVQADFRKYQSPEKFDVIVSNPPYFVDSLGCPDQQRNSARHNDSLTYEELLEGVTGLLTENGTFTIVIPKDVADRVKMIASEKKLQAVRQLNVITKPGGIPKRTPITFSFSNQECIVEELLTEVARHQYSKEYIALTREYYLNM